MNKSKILLSLMLCGLFTACSTTQNSPTSSDAEYAPVPAPEPSSAAKMASAQTTSAQNNRVRSEERLGTKWGDEVSSHVTQIDLKRLSNNPVDETQIRYASKQFSGRSINSISLAAGKISFSVIDDRGRILPLYRDGQTYYLSANDGQSYQLRYSNTSQQTFEIVASVDGLDVLDGSQASRSKSGYVLRPFSSFAIEGFRKSNSAVASFTFSKPQDAYAANNSSGSIQNTGVIGTVVYELKAPKYYPMKKTNDGYAPAPNAFPAD
ncbi:hypothetical protein [uncultured Acinetobacter sp.]|uniref:hypothetical protein n=1 Tax=uncultured Acinetobacter sp. TaxID=165433 RepID=UPI0025F861B0|nr:hypothetical protein [uncultured Acinetobacter sp.]